MRNGDAEADSGAHGLLALLEGGEDAFAVVGFDAAELNEKINQLDDGGPALGRLHLGNDLLGRE